MANLKDLIVNGAARVIGKLYASEFVGKLTGNADTATKLGTATVGGTTTPIYLDAGTPTALSYTIAKSVPSDAVFTDTKVTQTAVADSDYSNYRPLLWGASNNPTAGFTPSSVTDGVFACKGLYVRPSEGLIHAAIFEGNATSATSAASADSALTVKTTSIGTNSTKYLTFVQDNNNEFASESVYTNSGLTYNPYTKTLTTTTFSGSLNGNAKTATSTPDASYAAKIGTSTSHPAIGSTTKPIYIDANGNPTAIGYTIETSVPKNAVFTDTKYTHPTYTSKSSGLYKITVDGTGHVSSATAVTKADITGLGIPGSDTNTWNANTKDADGYVAKGINQANRVWKTDASGNPGWRVDTDTKYTFSAGSANGTIAVSVNGGTFTDVAVQGLGSNAYSSTSYLPTAGGTITGTTASSSTSTGALIVKGGLGVAGNIYGGAVYGAVFNDLADSIPVDDDCILEHGYCYCFDGEKYTKSSKYLDDGIIGIHSDTYGFKMGDEEGKKKMDVAVSGFVLAYVDKKYKPGTPLTCTENGYLTEIKKEDKIEHPEKIIATYWKDELSEEWGIEERKVRVNGRKWVKIY